MPSGFVGFVMATEGPGAGLPDPEPPQRDEPPERGWVSRGRPGRAAGGGRDPGLSRLPPQDHRAAATASFGRFTLWGLEAVPGPDARVRGALGWPSLAAAVSGRGVPGRAPHARHAQVRGRRLLPQIHAPVAEG